MDDAVKAYNAAIQASLGYAPEYIAFGVEPPLLGITNPGARRLEMGLAPWTIEDHILQREAIQEAAENNMRKAQNRQKCYFDRRRRVIRFMPGSLVRMLRNTTERARGRKFMSPWIGPLIVVEEKHPDVYRLQHRDTGKMVRRTVNVERLAPFFEREGVVFVPPPGRQGPIQGTFESDDDSDGTIVDTRGPHQRRSEQSSEEDAEGQPEYEELDADPTTQSEDESSIETLSVDEDSDTRPHSQEIADEHPDTQVTPGEDALEQSELNSQENQSDTPSADEDSDARSHVQEIEEEHPDIQETPGEDTLGQSELDSQENQSDMPGASEPDNQSGSGVKELRRSDRIKLNQEKKKQEEKKREEEAAQGKNKLPLPASTVSHVRRLFWKWFA
jgi:hypothetical protein